METLEERVVAGALWLDMVGPTGWRDRIDWSQLDMDFSNTCILGQVFAGHMRPCVLWHADMCSGHEFPGYYWAEDHFDLSPSAMYSLGFFDQFDGERLGDTWRALVEA